MTVCALMMGATAYAQEDVTDTYLKNADLKSLEGWDYGDPFGDGVFNYTDWKTDGDVPVIEFYHSWSANAGAEIGSTKNFHFTQKVTLPAGNYRLKVNGFYREGNGNGTNTKAYIFAGEKQQFMVGLSSSGVASYSGSNDLYKAANAFSKGDFSNEFDFDVEADAEIEIGFRGYIDTYCSWCILGPVKLLKYSLEDYLNDYNAKADEAKALYNEPMNKDVLAELKAAVVDPKSFKLIKEVTAAIQTLEEKIAAAKQSIADYKATKEAFDAYDVKAAALDAAGKAAYDAAVASIKSAYDARTMEGNQAEAVKAAYVEALKKQTAAGSDFTECAPSTWDGQTGEFGGLDHIVAERYNATDRMPYEYDGDVMTQTLTDMPAGAYKVVLEAAASFTSGRGFTCKTGDDIAVVFANNTTANLPVIDRGWVSESKDCGPYELICKVGADGILKYGIQKIDPLAGNWFLVNLLSITKVEYIPVESINAADVEVEVDKTAEIGASVAPQNATLPQIIYTSADEAIATVDKSGVVKGIAVGKTTITLKADEVEKTINVNVVAPAVLPESITLNQTEIALNAGENTTFTLTATIAPAEANQEVTFASSNEAIATVSADGVITVAGIGEATITVTSKAKEDVKATAKVTVTAAEINSYFAEEVEDGEDYWIINAATGKFLGGANSWGTRASLIKHGIPFKAVAKGENVFNLDSYTSNGGDSHFLAGEWIDGAATDITLVPHSSTKTIKVGVDEYTAITNAFNLKIGDNMLVAKCSNTEVDLKAADENDLFAQWYFVSRGEMVANMMMADEEHPADATFLIKDFNFSRNNTQYGAWEITTAGNVTNAQNPKANENHYNWNVECYHGTFDMMQPIVLPNGKYRLKAQGFYRQDGEDNDNIAYFYANDQKQTFPLKTGAENSMNEAAASFSKGLYTIEPIEVTVTDYQLKIGAANPVNTALWCIWDNFELECLSMDKNQDGIEVTIGKNGYATLYYNYLNLVVPEGVTAFTATTNADNKLLLSPIEESDNEYLDDDEKYVIPAATGVVLKGEPGTYKFRVIYDAFNTITDNELLGTDEETTLAEEGFKYYMLAVKDNDPSTIGFYYQTADGSSITNGAHKAYLRVEGLSAPQMFSITDPTGIFDVTTVTTESNEVYSISGVRMNNQSLQKGLYIINGKKVIVK